ncbi:MAG: protein translocase subunit SecD, partial [Pseudomonadota bacterium]
LKATARVDTTLMETVEKTLKANSIQLDGMFTDPNSIKVRFRDTDTQLKAKDVLDQALNPDRESPAYILALNLISDSPAWFTAINALPMYLGLDLRGGIYFLLQVDLKAALSKRLDGQLAYIRNALREKKIPYAGIAREGQAIGVKFRDAETRDKAQREIERVTPDFALKTVDDAGEFRIVATLTQQAQTETQKSAIEQNITTLRNRVNELGVAEPIIQQQGADRIVVQLPGVQDTARAKDILGRTATLEIRMVEAHASDPAARDYDPAKIDAAVKGNVPFGTELFYERRGPTAEPLLVSKQVVITGERLTKAAPTFDQRDQRPVVAIELDGQGARLMRDATRDSIKRRMAVLLIEKGKPEVITAPTIQDQLGGSFQITGSKSPREASDLALLLRAGALAAPMDIIEERTVGPSLGAENIKIGFHSTWIGFAAVTVFMIAYYLMFGLISIIALAVNVLFLIALLSMLQATLTLPGVAGIALTVGMAIDANVLI